MGLAALGVNLDPLATVVVARFLHGKVTVFFLPSPSPSTKESIILSGRKSPCTATWGWGVMLYVLKSGISI